MAFKYEGFAVGETIRCQDFEHVGDVCYVEGPIRAVHLRGTAECSFAHYVVQVTADCWEGVRSTTRDSTEGEASRVGMSTIVPMESTRDWEGRIRRVVS